jgi:hypothetical protein
VGREYSESWLRHRVAFYQRNLVNAGLATEAEVATVASEFPGESKDELFMALAHLMSLSRRREWQGKRNGKGQPDPDALDVALRALEDRPEVVDLPTPKLTVRVVPAAWARIMRIEDLDYWLQQLVACRMLLQDDMDRVEEPERTLRELADEIDRIRADLYAQVTAPGPELYEGDPPAWVEKITPAEETAILQAWHRVNLEPLLEMPNPKSKKGKDLPRHWSYVFESVAWRERRPAREVTHNRSLISLVAQTVMSGLRDADGKQAKGEALKEALHG